MIKTIALDFLPALLAENTLDLGVGEEFLEYLNQEGKMRIHGSENALKILTACRARRHLKRLANCSPAGVDLALR